MVFPCINFLFSFDIVPHSAYSGNLYLSISLCQSISFQTLLCCTRYCYSLCILLPIHLAFPFHELHSLPLSIWHTSPSTFCPSPVDASSLLTHSGRLHLMHCWPYFIFLQPVSNLSYLSCYTPPFQTSRSLNLSAHTLILSNVPVCLCLSLSLSLSPNSKGCLPSALLRQPAIGARGCCCSVDRLLSHGRLSGLGPSSGSGWSPDRRLQHIPGSAWLLKGVVPNPK